MNSLHNRVNATSASILGPLTTETSARALGEASPVLATPAIAAGVATAAAFVAGYAVEEAGDK